MPREGPAPGPGAPDLVQAFASAESHPRQVFLFDEDGELTCGEVCRRIRLLARRFEGWRLRPSERVVLASREDRATSVLFLALLRLGIPAVLLDPSTGPGRARRLIEFARPSAFLVDRDLVDAWGLASAANVLTVAPERRRSLLHRLRGRGAPDTASYPGCLAGGEPGDLPDAIDPSGDAYVLFTSGTVAEPKGVRITHRALRAHLGTLGRVYGYGPSCRVFDGLALSHADGIIQGPVAAFAHGIAVVRTVRFRIQTIDEVLDALYRHRVSHLVAVPAMLALFERYARGRSDAFRTGDLRMIACCGAPLEEALWRRFEQTFGVPVVNVYGLTETVVGGLFAGPDEATRRHGTVGRPVDCEARVVSPDGALLPDGACGELQLRGEMVTAGYLHAPEATATVLSPDGWFRTGDLASRDHDGFYRIAGRLKSLIVRGGFNVHPEEVTEVLHLHPGVAEAVTFGLPDAVWGERVVSAVVAPGLTEPALAAHCREHLEEHKVPTRLVLLEELPRGRSHKVQLDEVRKKVEAILGTSCGRAGRNGAGEAAEIEQAVLEEAAACFRVPRASLDLASSPLDCPAWDSLAHLGLVTALESRFGVRFRPEDIVAIDTLDRAAAVVHRLARK